MWFVIPTAIYRDVLVFILKYLSKYNFFKKNIDNFKTNYIKKKNEIDTKKIRSIFNYSLVVYCEPKIIK